MDGLELRKFIIDILSLAPKHPVIEKFNEVQFLEDVDKLVFELRKNKAGGEKLCEIEASTIWFEKNICETQRDRGVKKCMIT